MNRRRSAESATWMVALKSYPSIIQVILKGNRKNLPTSLFPEVNSHVTYLKYILMGWTYPHLTLFLASLVNFLLFSSRGLYLGLFF